SSPMAAEKAAESSRSPPRIWEILSMMTNSCSGLGIECLFKHQFGVISRESVGYAHVFLGEIAIFIVALKNLKQYQLYF
ncbi:MAG: hypothetical protein AAF663_12015, partial [Planctomycetota bacterium]